MASSIVTIALGDPGLSNLGNESAVQHQSAGMDFHERRWAVNRLGQVRYLQGSHSFDIPRVSGVTGSSYLSSDVEI